MFHHKDIDIQLQYISIYYLISKFHPYMTLLGHCYTSKNKNTGKRRHRNRLAMLVLGSVYYYSIIGGIQYVMHQTVEWRVVEFFFGGGL